MSRKRNPKPDAPTPKSDAELSAQEQSTESVAAEVPAEAGVAGQHHLDDDWNESESVPAEQAARALEEAEDRFLRLAAEYDNYRRRTTREKAESFDRGASALAERLLDVLDDFDRLAGHDPDPEDHLTVREALDLILAKFGKELQAGGLERIDPTGKKFDPNDHDAVAIATADDPSLDDLVKATFQVGYRFRGNLIRPAKVQVWSVDGTL